MIVFLDYDGVLHPDEVYRRKGHLVLRVDGELFMWASRLVDVLRHYPQVQIVLSTSWARELGFARARRWLPDELKRRVIGATWHSSMAYSAEGLLHGHKNWWDTATRYEQIKRWVERAGTEDWIAIDDNPEGWNGADEARLVQTSSEAGLSDPLAIQRLHSLLSAT